MWKYIPAAKRLQRSNKWGQITSSNSLIAIREQCQLLQLSFRAVRGLMAVPPFMSTPIVGRANTATRRASEIITKRAQPSSQLHLSQWHIKMASTTSPSKQISTFPFCIEVRAFCDPTMNNSSTRRGRGEDSTQPTRIECSPAYTTRIQREALRQLM